MSAQNSVLVRIARPYATALYELAHSEGVAADVEQSLDALVRLAHENPDFQRYLRSPVITADAKVAALGPILQTLSLHPFAANVVRVLARNGRLFALLAVAEQFKVMAAQGRGEVSAEVTSAAPLSAQQLSHLAETLRQRIGKTVTLNERVDASLIGGLIVKVGSQMIDSSLKTKLTAMKIAMKEVG